MNITEPIIRMTYKGQWISYNPKPDITTYELAKLHQLIAVSVVSPLKADIRDAFIDQYNLIRHFDYENTIN
jgi:hypothetical protein